MIYDYDQTEDEIEEMISLKRTCHFPQLTDSFDTYSLLPEAGLSQAGALSINVRKL